MEFVLGFSIIIILLLILGFGVDVIIIGIIALIGLAAAATEIVFLFFAVRLLFSKRAEAEFSRIGRTKKSRYDVAFYNVGDEELPNVFPAEMVMKKRLYKSGKTVKLRVDVKKKFVYDRNARLTILFGVPLCTLLCGFLAFFAAVVI
ncbi:MAG: hypothetical protein IJU82_01710 [Ruminiclostridium sp.]|nr:hypothetical protein [Ruminiclostridium sp.]